MQQNILRIVVVTVVTSRLQGRVLSDSLKTLRGKIIPDNTRETEKEYDEAVRVSYL
jgi:hypothetical protein